jgi:VWFA-related protein
MSTPRHIPIRLRRWICLVAAVATLCLSGRVPAQTSPETTTPPVTLHVAVKLVQINCTAANRKTRATEEITSPEQVRVFEDNKLQTLLGLRHAEDTPLVLGILLDISGSEAGEWDRMKRQTIHFIAETLRPGDRVFIVTFNVRLRILLDITKPTDTPAHIAAKLDNLQEEYGVEVHSRNMSGNGTRLWDAMDFATEAMAPHQGRKAIVVFTDGLDNASAAQPPAILRRAQELAVPFYAIRVWGMELAGSVAAGHSPPGSEILPNLVDKSGGVLLTATRDRDVAAALGRMAGLLRSQFVVEYRPPPDSQPGFHHIRIEAVDHNIEIHGKAGMWR